MLRAECFKQRMEKGLSFLEFNYMLLQSYDFYCLARDIGCKIEFGGNDQWSNILFGADLARRLIGKDDYYGMTFSLLTNSEGKKMGKTQKGALWLDAAKTSPYEFYQYWRNGEEEAKKAQDGARAAFSGGGALDNVPTTKMERSVFEGEGIGVVNQIREIGIAPSNGEGFRTIKQGGLTIEGEKVTDPKMMITLDSFNDEKKLLIKKGKKTYRMVEIDG